jgi:serine O-acetyltransferase
MKDSSAWRLMLEAINSDLDRYVITDNLSWVRVIFTKRGLWATIQYRYSRWVNLHCHVPGLRPLLKVFCALWRLGIEMITGIELPNRAEIGKGLFIPHAHGIIIHQDCLIGDYCNLSQDVSIGLAGRGENAGTPKIGHRVFIGPGAKVIGSITIGNDVAIGSNAVVTKDLPDHAVAVGIPAKIINYKGSEDFIIYRQ